MVMLSLANNSSDIDTSVLLSEITTQTRPNSLLDRSYFKQLRVEREQRQDEEDEYAKAHVSAITYDRDTTVKSRVSNKQASRSINRMDS
jgi:hypothetical protein